MRRSQPTQTIGKSSSTKNSFLDFGLLVMMLSIFLFSSLSMNANTFDHDNPDNNFETTLEDFTDCTSISFKDYHVVDPTCGNNDGTISFRVNNPNNYCLVYRLYNYNTSSWVTGYQTSRIFTGLPAAQYRVKMYVDHNCNVNNPSTGCYTPSAYKTLTCTSCAPVFTVNNNGSSPARLLWWKNTGDEDVTIIQPGASHSLTARDGAMFRVIDTPTDWSNLLYDEHTTVTGCSNQTWNISPNYGGNSSCTGDITSIVYTNGTESITLQNGSSYQSCNLPTGGYLEAVVSGNHESFKFTVDGSNRTENSEPYNFPAVSNGQTWNPGVGTHNIAGKLYSENSLGGTLCDEMNIQITIEDCNNTGTCNNFTNGGVISSSQTICPGNSVNLQNVELPSGGSGATTDYIWLGNTAGPYTDNPTVYEVNQSTYTTGALTQTTWFRRCARRAGCTDYDGESNWIKITVDNNGCNTACTGDITSIIYTNGTESITLQNGGSYQSCNLPAGGYLEAVVSGSHESFKFTVDGSNRTENEEPYNFPAVSNGQTWNPGVGTHNIAGKLYSENSLGGTLCDEMNIQITIEDCNNNTTGAINSIILTNGSESITLQNGGTYRICDLPSNNYLEAVVSGSHESFKFTVDGFNRTENSEPYNYPAVSNGQTWNPGVGIHNIAGKLYSENSLGGTLLDDVNIQITIEDCTITPPSDPKTCSVLDHGTADNFTETRLLWLDIDGQGIKEYSIVGTSSLIENADGTASITGMAEQVDNTCNVWEYNVRLINKRSWSQWSALGRSYKASGVDNHTAWDYYELDNTNSKFIGKECLAGKTLNLTHNPSSYEYGFQIGDGANDKDGDFGFSGWYAFSGSYTGHGDFNGDLNCGTATCNYDCNDVCERTVTPTVQCNSGTEYLNHVNADVQPGTGNVEVSGTTTWKECGQTGTAVYESQGYFNGDLLTFRVSLSNKTTNPSMSPKEHICLDENTSGWVYYEDVCGEMISAQHGTFIITRKGPAFQVGYGANVTSNDLGFGGCGWFFLSGGDGFYNHGDFNIMLSDVTSCDKGTIGDKVFEDKNGNGIQDAGEPGIDGVTVMVLDANGNMVGQTTTSGGGLYGFGDVPAGDYKIKFTAPNGYTYTTPNAGNDDDKDSDATPMAGTDDAMSTVFTVNGGDNITNVDAGLYVPAKIGNFVFEDTNENGIQDAGEPGIEGVTVMLLYPDGNMAGQTTTNANGYYLFDDIHPGNYKVKFPQSATTNSGVTATLTTPNQGTNDAKDSDAVPMAGTTDAMSQVVYVGSGEEDKTIDAGFIPGKASIGDIVFEDKNGNGIQDAGEPGIDGVTVMLLDENGNPTGQTTTTTNGGQYDFTDIAPGTYKVKFTAPNGYTFTSPNQGNDDSKDSDATPMAGTNDAMTTVFTVNAGDDIDDIDAGLYEPIKIGNKVFEDLNGDGIQDSGEPGISGVTVMLLDANGNMVAGVPSQTTDANGNYNFTDLAPGTYKVKFTAPTQNGITADLTQPNQGTQEGKDSDAIEMPGSNDAMTELATVVSGDIKNNIDAGYYFPAKIGDKVFEDTNGNGIQDTNEPGIDGVTVMLIDGTGSVAGTTTTTNGGFYEFDGLAPDVYKVKFPQSATTNSNDAANLTEPNQGNDDTKDSDATPVAGTNDAESQVVTIESGDDLNTIDAGYIPEGASIGNKVFEDLNGNGIQDSGEPGIANVTVMLLDANGNMVGQPQTTNSNGFYDFTNLTPGDYKVKFTAPTENGVTAELTEPNQGTQEGKDSDAIEMPGTNNAMTELVTLNSGDDKNNVDAGYFFPAKLGNFVFEDTDEDGVQDTGEPGIEGVVVELLDGNGNPTGQTTTTDSNGAYEFAGLAPGDYKVRFPEEIGGTEIVLFKDCNYEGDDLTLGIGDYSNIQTAGFSNDVLSSIKIPDGIKVTLFQHHNFGGASIVLTADDDCLTDNQFDNQVSSLKVESISGSTSQMTLTLPNQGSDDTIDSDAVPMAGTNDAMSQVVTLSSGDDNETVDAGYVAGKASIGDIVFEDKNGNGIQDPNEPGIDGVTVMLLDVNGNMVGLPTTTSGGGEYSFTNLAPGTYKVKFTAPTQNGVTAEITDVNQGNDDTVDSDAVGIPNSNDAMTAPITLNSGDNNNDVDAGYYFPASLGNFVWEDTNLNGIQDFGEAGLPGVPVELRDGNGNPTGQTTSTDADGLYKFTGLAPGDYKVVFPTATSVNSADLILTASDLGGNDAADSDAIAMAVVNEAMSPVVTLESGDDNDSIDAGYFETATIGDKAFNDQNQNGLQDSGDTPLPGVTVMLIGTDAFGNAVNQTLVTDQDGEYLFTNVVPGTYEVKFTQPVTFIVTEKDTQGNGFDFGDSDIDPLTGKTAPITISSGDDNRDIDAGFYLDPALPVALTSFEAQLVNNSEVVLKWATASEEDNSHFIVERSADGTDFEAIGTVAGNGTTNQINNYSLVDKDPYYGYNYYRLKQVDFDGDYEFSQIETVIISSQDVPDVIIYPNPVMTTTTLRVVTPFETDAQVEVVDQTGKVVLNVTMAKGANSKQLDMSRFAAGMYFAYVNYNGHRELVHKIIKVEE